MALGHVHTVDAHRGTGTVALRPSGAPVPFSARRTADAAFTPGERVEYRVVGGRAGVQATDVRRLG